MQRAFRIALCRAAAGNLWRDFDDAVERRVQRRPEGPARVELQRRRHSESKRCHLSLGNVDHPACNPQTSCAPLNFPSSYRTHQ